MKPKDSFTKEQADLLEKFKLEAEKNGSEFFALVGDPKTGTGASVFGTTSLSSEDSAARNARKAHIKWETERGINPDHDRDNS